MFNFNFNLDIFHFTRSIANITFPFMYYQEELKLNLEREAPIIGNIHLHMTKLEAKRIVMSDSL